jgi:hypothetical protein
LSDGDGDIATDKRAHQRLLETLSMLHLSGEKKPSKKSFALIYCFYLAFTFIKDLTQDKERIDSEQHHHGKTSNDHSDPAWPVRRQQ